MYVRIVYMLTRQCKQIFLHTALSLSFNVFNILLYKQTCQCEYTNACKRSSGVTLWLENQLNDHKKIEGRGRYVYCYSRDYHMTLQG